MMSQTVGPAQPGSIPFVLSTDAATNERSGRSAIDTGNRQELSGIQACAADESAVDVFDREQLFRIGGLHRPTVKDAYALRFVTEARRKPPANEAVHVADVVPSRRQPGS